MTITSGHLNDSSFTASLIQPFSVPSFVPSDCGSVCRVVVAIAAAEVTVLLPPLPPCHHVAGRVLQSMRKILIHKWT